MPELNDGGSRVECLQVWIRERPTGRYPTGNLIRDHPSRMERQLGEVSQLLALVLMGQECLECVWSVWKRSFQLSWWGSHQGKAPAGPAVCKERRTCGWWRPSGAQGSQILGAVRRGILRTATLDLQRTDCGLLRSLVDKSPLGDSVKGLQSIPQEGNPKGTEAEMGWTWQCLTGGSKRSFPT